MAEAKTEFDLRGLRKGHEIKQAPPAAPTELWAPTGNRRLAPRWFGLGVCWEYEQKRLFWEADRWAGHATSVRRTRWSRKNETER